MGSIEDNERFGAWVNKETAYQQGMVMVLLWKWHLGQWLLGAINPNDNMRGMNEDDNDR